MSKKRENSGESEALPTNIIAIKELRELQALFDQRITVEFDFQGKRYSLEARRLTPAEDAMLDMLLTEVLPPMKPGKTLEEDRPDYTNVEYLHKKAEAEILVRALALYWCVPIYAQEKPGLTDRREIVAFVQSKLHTEIQNVLFQAVRHSGIREAQLVNFSLPSVSKPD